MDNMFLEPNMKGQVLKIQLCNISRKRTGLCHKGLLTHAYVISLAEKQRNAPNSRQCDHRVNNPADDSSLPAKDPSDYIELKNTDAAPVQRADDE